MAACVPVGLAFGWAIPALIDLGAWMGERLSDASRLLLAAAIVGAWAVLARALTRQEVARG
jgi:hypothetical protein